MEKEVIIKNANLTGIVNYLNSISKKQNGRCYTPRDVLGYIRRGFLPSYFGSIRIEEVENENCSVKLYNLVKTNENIC